LLWPGLVAGGVPTLLFVPLRALGYVGSLLNGAIGMCCYFLTCSWAFGHLDKDLDTPLLFFGFAAGFGLLVGHVILHPLARASQQGRLGHLTQ
jgi:NhaP-type Na+/H+ or K+/H+ antiporter